LLAFGVFELNADGSQKLLRPGRAAAGSRSVQAVNTAAITEQVTHSWYHDSTNNLNPANGATVPAHPKAGGYSWLKAPRYSNEPYEAGALARMWVNGDYTRGISVMDRHAARAFETLKIILAMQTWVNQIVIGQSPYSPYTTPANGTGIGLTEAPRGALGHWLRITKGRIGHYQIVTPTCWNASPMDDQGRAGPIEQALANRSRCCASFIRLTRACRARFTSCSQDRRRPSRATRPRRPPSLWPSDPCNPLCRSSVTGPLGICGSPRGSRRTGRWHRPA
jgi:hydrogenase large subunit